MPWLLANQGPRFTPDWLLRVVDRTGRALLTALGLIAIVAGGELPEGRVVSSPPLMACATTFASACDVDVTLTSAAADLRAFHVAQRAATLPMAAAFLGDQRSQQIQTIRIGGLYGP